MVGAIIGDIVGSRFEKKNLKSKDFDLFTKQSRYTDDTVLTIAIAEISIGGDSDTIACMTGAISEAYYKSIPKEFIAQMNKYLPNEFRKTIGEFKQRFGD